MSPQLGICYYPEHWPEGRWAIDAAAMAELGLRYVRIGEFAWALIEPEPGVFAWDWLDRAIATLGQAGLRVVLGTPTATPPAWLVRAAPDILPVDSSGLVRGFGSRRHYSFNSPRYQEESQRVVTALAERYGQHEHVAGWQIDNEFGCHDTFESYGPHDATAFRTWLRARYGTIGALNAAWGTVFWSQTYRDFDEIDPPGHMVTDANPSHLLDFKRFSVDAIRRFNQAQVAIIRPRSPGRFITTNLISAFNGLDRALAADLDFLSWDNYPLGMLSRGDRPYLLPGFMRSGDADQISFWHDQLRGTTGRSFWIMEQQVGQVNWGRHNPLPAPGAVRLWTYHDIAHGADVVSYFRWRAALIAQEQYHSGLLRHDASPDRGYAELIGLAQELERLGELPVPQPLVALLYDVEDRWAIDAQPHAEGFGYDTLVASFYRVLRSLGADVDVVPSDAPLDHYRLVVAPSLHLADEALAAHLTAYVTAGGRLVLGPRSGMKDRNGLVFEALPLGPLTKLAGVRVVQIDSIAPQVSAEVAHNSNVFSVTLWAEVLELEGAEPAASHASAFYAGLPAATRRAVGAGEVVYIGVFSDGLIRALLTEALHAAGLAPHDLPEGVRLMRRGGLSFAFNFTDMLVPTPAHFGASYLVGGPVLPPAGVAVFR